MTDKSPSTTGHREVQFRLQPGSILLVNAGRSSPLFCGSAFLVLITTTLAIFIPVFDAIGSMPVGLLLALISYKMAIEIKRFRIYESVRV